MIVDEALRFLNKVPSLRRTIGARREELEQLLPLDPSNAQDGPSLQKFMAARDFLSAMGGTDALNGWREQLQAGNNPFHEWFQAVDQAFDRLLLALSGLK